MIVSDDIKQNKASEFFEYYGLNYFIQHGTGCSIITCTANALYYKSYIKFLKSTYTFWPVIIVYASSVIVQQGMYSILYLSLKCCATPCTYKLKKFDIFNLGYKSNSVVDANGDYEFISCTLIDDSAIMQFMTRCIKISLYNVEQFNAILIFPSYPLLWIVRGIVGPRIQHLLFLRLEWCKLTLNNLILSHQFVYKS